MNPLPPNADELVSAYLDGQAAPDEVAIVESSPELMERVETLRSVSNLLGAPVTAPPEQKEAHISAALDAFDALFAADSADAQNEPPSLSAVPDPPASEDPTQAPESTGVTSLQAARERRRRFHPGIIAAAVATVLLFVALAAFGLGNNSSDVATGAAPDADDTAASSSMADVDESGSALNELQAAPTTTTAEAASEALEFEEAMDEEAMDDEEAMADDAAMDDEEAMADEEGAVAAASPESDSDTAGDAAAAEPADDLPFAFFAGTFPDQDSLQLEFEQFALEELEQRVARIGPGLFPGCQQDIAELRDIETATLIADAFIDDQAVEVHQVANPDGTITFIIVDASECTILPSAP